MKLATLLLELISIFICFIGNTAYEYHGVFAQNRL